MTGMINTIQDKDMIDVKIIDQILEICRRCDIYRDDY